VAAGAAVVGVVTAVWAAARLRRPREAENVLNCMVDVAFIPPEVLYVSFGYFGVLVNVQCRLG
jgi:hypothetical protein